MEYFNKKIVIIAAILAMLGIGLGAFGAHGLKGMIDGPSLQSFETGIRYQMYHALALLILGFSRGVSIGTVKWVVRFFLAGILFFSGSIYLLALKEILPFSVYLLGPVTPLGGLLLMAGWIRLVYGLLTIK